MKFNSSLLVYYTLFESKNPLLKYKHTDLLIKIGKYQLLNVMQKLADSVDILDNFAVTIPNYQKNS